MDIYYGHPDDLLDYIENHPHTKARYSGKVGTLSIHQWASDKPKRPRIRFDNRRRWQYQTISEYGMRYLEIKVGHRYVLAREVLS